MALPSVVTLGSIAFVVAAGVGYAAVSTASAGSAQPGVHQVQHPSTGVGSTPGTSRSPGSGNPSTVPPRARTAVVPHVLVVVFNNTGVTGVAEQKAAILRDDGWNVAATDNWYGDIPADTVYYPPQLKADAVKLAKVLHIARLHPAVAPMQFDELTVIFATG